jgi:hypothetical protein
MMKWMMLTGVAIVAPGLAAPTPFLCSVSTLRHNPEGYHYPLEDIKRFVAEAEIIVRAVAVDSVDGLVAEPADWPRQEGRGVVLRVVETFRGTLQVASLTMPGVLVARDDFNEGAVPYRIVRRAGQRGDCYAREYRRGGEYLILLRRIGSTFTPHWAALAPLNEQIRGADDPWLAWVRSQLVQ